MGTVAFVVQRAREPLVREQRPLATPRRGEVRIRVRACGVCHSDSFVTDGLWPGLELPRVPGHEIAGVVDVVGEDVTSVAVNDRVGVGWHGGHDGTCPACLRGQFLHCAKARITGVTMDGGYAEHVIVPAVAVAHLPDRLDFVAAAPLMCAGVTTFNALRNAGARPGDLVAVHGLGGLGHLGVQYARAMGFAVVAIARGREKADFARRLGADDYVDSETEDAAEVLRRKGGARVILATAPSADAISKLVGGLGVEGCLLIVAAPFEPMQIGAVDLISRTARVQGWASGTAVDSTEALAFAERTGVAAMIETFPLDRADAGIERMRSGQARFRVVLVPGA